MKVLFRKPVPPFTVGQVVEVAEGYATNYLIPKNLAVPATHHALQEVQRRSLKQVAAAAGAVHDLDALRQRLAGAIVHIDAPAAPSGTLYAAVTPVRIADSIAKQTGHAFPVSIQKQLPTLKHTGQHPVTLQIHATTVTFTLDV